MSDDRFYPGAISWKGRVVHVLWRSSGDSDEYLFDSQRRYLRTLSMRDELESFAKDERLHLEASAPELSLDVVLAPDAG